MSWSRTFTGRPSEIVQRAAGAREGLKADVPAFEHGDVDRALDALTTACGGVPAEASVNASVSGHAWRNTSTTEAGESTLGGGEINLNLIHTADYTREEDPEA